MVWSKHVLFKPSFWVSLQLAVFICHQKHQRHHCPILGSRPEPVGPHVVKQGDFSGIGRLSIYTGSRILSRSYDLGRTLFITQKSDLSIIPSSTSQASPLISWSLLSMPIAPIIENHTGEAQWSQPCSSDLPFYHAKTLGSWEVCCFGLRTQGSLCYLGSSISRV